MTIDANALGLNRAVAGVLPVWEPAPRKHMPLRHGLPNKMSSILPPLPTYSQGHSSCDTATPTSHISYPTAHHPYSNGRTVLPPLPATHYEIRAPYMRPNVPDPSNLRDFVAHLVKVGRVNCVEYILALSYLNRLAAVIEKFCVESRDIPAAFIRDAKEGNAFVGRIFLVCLLLACKYSKEAEDCVVNKCWADVSGLGLRQVNALERDVMRALDYSLHVSGKEWCKWQDLYAGRRSDPSYNTSTNPRPSAPSFDDTLDATAPMNGPSKQHTPAQKLVLVVFIRLTRALNRLDQHQSASSSSSTTSVQRSIFNDQSKPTACASPTVRPSSYASSSSPSSHSNVSSGYCTPQSAVRLDSTGNVIAYAKSGRDSSTTAAPIHLRLERQCSTQSCDSAIDDTHSHHHPYRQQQHQQQGVNSRSSMADSRPWFTPSMITPYPPRSLATAANLRSSYLQSRPTTTFQPLIFTRSGSAHSFATILSTPNPIINPTKNYMAHNNTVDVDHGLPASPGQSIEPARKRARVAYP